jgi:hypothetical protein
MDCVVCGKPFGMWARLSGEEKDTVCKECEREGATRLKALASSVRPERLTAELLTVFDELSRH